MEVFFQTSVFRGLKKSHGVNRGSLLEGELNSTTEIVLCDPLRNIRRDVSKCCRTIFCLLQECSNAVTHLKITGNCVCFLPDSLRLWAWMERSHLYCTQNLQAVWNNRRRSKRSPVAGCYLYHTQDLQRMQCYWRWCSRPHLGRSYLYRCKDMYCLRWNRRWSFRTSVGRCYLYWSKDMYRLFWKSRRSTGSCIRQLDGWEGSYQYRGRFGSQCLQCL